MVQWISLPLGLGGLVLGDSEDKGVWLEGVPKIGGLGEGLKVGSFWLPTVD